MRSPRSVTVAAIGMPSRSLKAAIDFLARRVAGRWPVIRPSSSIAASSSLMFCVASPIAHVDHDLGQAGHGHDARVAPLLHQARHHLLLVRLFHPRQGLGRSHLSSTSPVRREVRTRVAVVEQLRPDARALVVVGRDDHHVRHVDRGLALGDAALDVALRVGLGVALDEVDALHQQPALLGQHLQHLAALAAVAAGDDLHQVVLLDPDPDPDLGFSLSRHGVTAPPGPAIRSS